MNRNSGEIFNALGNILGLTARPISGGRLDSNRDSRKEEPYGVDHNYDSTEQEHQSREKYEWRSPPGKYSYDSGGGNAQNERKKLQLAPRTKPIELNPPSAEAIASSSIFGGAKPVNTAAREREIEERLAKEKEGEETRQRKFSSSSGLSNRSRCSSVSSQPGSWYHDDNALLYKTPFPRQHERDSPTRHIPKTRYRSSSNSSSIESDRENQMNSKTSKSQSNRNKGSFIGVNDDISSQKSEYHSYGHTIGQVLSHFYENNLHTDIVFHVRCGDGYIRFPCHKLVLSLWSPVFADMFFKKELSETVEITGVPPSAFEVLIKYCYGLETELQKFRNDVNFLLKIYKGAQKYKIKGLQVLCCEIFSCALPNKDNVFELLDAASFIGSESLKVRCHKVLQTQTKQIIESRELSDISRPVINTILEMPILSFYSECELITWMFEWASQESVKHGDITLREIMTPFLPRLNFMALKPEEFGSLILMHKEFFDEKEGFQILMNIIFPDSWPLPPWFGEEFNRFYIDSNNVSLTEFRMDS